MKDAERAALQHELKFYTNLLENHEKKMQTMKSVSAKANLPGLNDTVKRNGRISSQSFRAISMNHVSCSKSVNCLNRALTNTMHKGFNGCNTIHKEKVLQKNSNIESAAFHENIVLQNQLKNYPYRYKAGKSNKYIKLDTFNEPVNIKESLQNNMLNKKDHLDSQKQLNPVLKGIPSALASQKLFDEIIILTKQLKQKSKDISPSKKSNYRTINSPTKNQLNFQSNAEVSVQHKHNVYKKTSPLKKNSNLILHVNPKNFLNSETNIKKNVSVSSKLSTNSNLPLNDNVKSSKINLGDLTNDQSMKPQLPVENKNESVDSLSKPVLKMSLNSANSIKKSLNLLQVNSCLKTPVKVKLIKKHSNIKKVGARTKLNSSKYKVINKKSPCVQITTCRKPILKSLKNTSKFNKLNNSNRKWTNAQMKTNTSKSIAETNKLNSKYKIVNKSKILHKSCMNKNIKRLSFSSNPDAHKIPSCNKNNSLIRKVFSTTKSNYRGIDKNVSHSKMKSSAIRFNLKKSGSHLTPKKIHSQSSNSKYRIVNKSSSSVNKVSKATVKHSNKLSDLHNSSMDLDLLLELAAEKNKCINNEFSPSKHVLTKRIYKSKNAIVNRTAHSAQDKAVKMIKSKYISILNKNMWQRQTVLKKFVSARFYNGNRLNASFQRKMLTSHYNQKNKSNFSKSKIGVHNPSLYFIQRNCRRYPASKNKYAFVCSGSSRNPKSFKRNTTYQKVSFKTPTRSKLTVPISKTLASRVLHRSINRVLTASKKASKCNQYCMFYNRFGRCNKGVKCPFVHDPKKIAVCTRFLRGTCKTKNCPFSHEICPGKMAICSFFLLGTCTKTDCPYRHETLSPDAKLCKAFVQGYCPKGRECKQAHILVCPQFIQGNCQKGDACAFPHPPSKERKNVPKTIEKNENTKAVEKNENPEEILLEKMSRYFEPLCEQVNVDKSNINNLVIPRIQSLPEQPAFIAFSLSDSET